MTDERQDHVERFEVRRLVDGAIRSTEVIASTPTPEGIGAALVTLHAEGEIGGDDRIGIRDRVEGTWVVNPFARGARR